MHSIIGRLIERVAEFLDRNLIIVPKLDEEYAACGTS
jgi:hypothetical protein